MIEEAWNGVGAKEEEEGIRGEDGRASVAGNGWKRW